MIRVWAITANTFREAIRDKILYTLLFFALLMIGAALFLADLTIGEYEKILKDMGLAAINLFGVLISVFLGIGLVYKEIERKTIYTIASKPVRRWEFLLGKYLGLVGTLALEVSLMTVGFFFVLLYGQTSIGIELLSAIWLTFVELLVITAIATLFSSFTTPVLAAMFTLSGALVGRLSSALKEFAEQGDRFGEAFQLFANILYRVWPDLETFNIRAAAAYGKAVDWEYVGYSTVYGLAWSASLLVLAALIFQRRDFK